ncbi:MAG: DUF459 domain-containing protein [Hyphomicrobiaceae bacterium]|nr:DUF459 domain-containing protein [Hyphomicrobiaceae bacterium]
MSGSAFFRSQSVPGFVRCAAVALAMLAAAVAHLSSAAVAQGLSHLSNSYVTPFPEQNRYRVYVFGDSLGDGLWAGLYRAFGPEQNIDVVKKSRVSTGFVRTDYFDWNKRLTRILAAEKVHIAVVMVGANDVQPIRVKNKKKRTWHKIGTAEWREVYSQRIDQFIKSLKGSKAAVYWVGLPIMRSAKYNNHMQIMNEIFRERAFINGVKFVDTWNGFADQFGRYSAFGPDLSGQVGRLRAGDGVHFTIRGYRKLAHFVEREIRRDMRQARSERDIPLAGNVEEQARAIRRQRAPSGQKQVRNKPSVSKPKKPVGRITPQAAARKKAKVKRVATVKPDAAKEGVVALPSADGSIEGIQLPRPKISQAALSAVSARYTPQSELIALETNEGVTALASISPISDTNLAEALRRLPLSQRPYYRVLVKGEELTPKEGRADDFTWPGS